MNIIIYGINGRMGKVLRAMTEEGVRGAKLHGGVEYAEQTMQNYRQKALALLPEGITADIRAAIIAYMDAVINRKK